MPKSRLDFWQTKLEANVKRDSRQIGELKATGWTVLTLWECETRDDAIVSAFVEDVAKLVKAGR